MAMKKAADLSAEDLCTSKEPVLLLKWVTSSRNSSDESVDKVTDLFKDADPSLLGPAIEKLLPVLGSVDMSDKDTGRFATLLSKRITWLNTEIESLDKPFSWVMPHAAFSDNVEVQAFLRGPEVPMKMSRRVRKFKGFHDANNYAAKWTKEKQVKASFKMEARSIDADAVVTITKTRKWFAECQQTLQQYKEELDRLKKALQRRKRQQRQETIPSAVSEITGRGYSTTASSITVNW
ncbi:hypothetical protein PRNP1_002136 [Phytophthora ramorum]